jgi:hypothetical protein
MRLWQNPLATPPRENGGPGFLEKGFPFSEMMEGTSARGAYGFEFGVLRPLKTPLLKFWTRNSRFFP